MKKEKKKVNCHEVVLGVMLVLLLTVGVVHASGGSLWDKVAEAAGQVLGQGLLSRVPDVSIAPVSSDGPLGASSITQQGVTHMRRLGLRDSDTSVSIDTWWEYETIGTSSSTFLSLRQNLPGDVYLDMSESFIKLEGTASSSPLFALATSTVALSPEQGTSVAVSHRLVNQVSVATSTVNAVISRWENLVTSSSTLVRIPQGVYIQGHQSLGSCIGANVCGSVTSTDRGYTTDSFAALKFIRITTSTDR